MVYGLRQFRPYILGHRTVVRSDHAALMYLKRAKEPVGQQSRWLDFIEQFTLDLQHLKEASHNNADALSRRPCEVRRPVSAVFWSLGRQTGLCVDKGGHSDRTSVVRGTGSAEKRSPGNRIVEDRHYPCTRSPATTPGGYRKSGRSG